MEIREITSRQNKLVRRAAALGEDAAARREQGLFLCEGARLCQDAALSGVEVEACFFTRRGEERYGQYLQPVLERAREAYRVEDHVAQLLSSTKNGQGVFCLCRRPEGLGAGLSGRELSGPCLVLEQLQDPGNLGTVLRTAEALGVGQVFLLGECCDPLSPKVLRASMGAVFRLRLGAEPRRDRCAPPSGGRAMACTPPWWTGTPSRSPSWTWPGGSRRCLLETRATACVRRPWHCAAAG